MFKKMAQINNSCFIYIFSKGKKLCREVIKKMTENWLIHQPFAFKVNDKDPVFIGGVKEKQRKAFYCVVKKRSRINENQFEGQEMYEESV